MNILPTQEESSSLVAENSEDGRRNRKAGRRGQRGVEWASAFQDALNPIIAASSLLAGFASSSLVEIEPPCAESADGSSSDGADCALSSQVLAYAILLAVSTGAALYSTVMLSHGYFQIARYKCSDYLLGTHVWPNEDETGKEDDRALPSAGAFMADHVEWEMYDAMNYFYLSVITYMAAIVVHSVTVPGPIGVVTGAVMSFFGLKIFHGIWKVGYRAAENTAVGCLLPHSVLWRDMPKDYASRRAGNADDTPHSSEGPTS